MTFPFRDKVTWTSGFDEPRPLWRVQKIAELEAAGEHVEAEAERAKLHPHGAQDFACTPGTKIYAPEDGRAWYHIVYGTGTQNMYWGSGTWYAFSNYIFSVWGGLVCLEGKSGLTHVFAHIEPRVMHKYCDLSKPSRQGALVSYVSIKALECVREGELLAETGNAGFSMGPHTHYEVHSGKDWTPHIDRVRPDELWSA